MEAILDIEKTFAPAIMRKNFRVEEIRKMIKVEILPEDGNYRTAEILEKGEAINCGTITRLSLRVEQITG